MGRLQPSVGEPPASFRRAARAKKAKATINQVIPPLLSSHPRARKGADAACLILDQGKTSQGAPTSNRGASNGTSTTSPPRVVLRVADTLTAARSLIDAHAHNNGSDDEGHAKPSDLANTHARVAILNMASPLSPGGGFVNGATSQEESLCMRTTLLPSLKDEWYRLPELGAVYTPDVLVFRSEDRDELLDKKDRWFVDCISAAMLRNPETERDEITGRGRYVDDRDRQLVLDKMKMVMRICCARGVKRLVLGAWGCGAYGNPVGEVVAAWRKVLVPKRDFNGSAGKKKSGKPRETWDSLEDVVFAIKDPGMAEAFAAAFGEGLERVESEDDEDDGEYSGEDGENANDPDTNELEERIRELKIRMETTTSPQLKSGLGAVLAGLASQLPSNNG